MQQLPSEMLSLIVACSVAVGVVQCFFGYRVFKLVLALVGFLLGGTLAGACGYALSDGEAAIAVIAGVIGGAIGSALMVALFFVGVFVMGALLGYVLGMVLSGVGGSSPEPAVLLSLAVIGGIVAIIFQKLMIILTTSFGGSWMVVTGIAYFIGRFNPVDPRGLLQSVGTELYAIILCWLALGIAGLVLQYRFIPLTDKEKEEKKNSSQAGPPP
ncbi:MAG: TMEM198/TM7SF3 family protein [Candidatus Sumerlaeota bacterium]|nr:TMEM198/TM7SF3 family protein [Candidatus Sumerlaeota bacterium]